MVSHGLRSKNGSALISIEHKPSRPHKLNTTLTPLEEGLILFDRRQFKKTLEEIFFTLEGRIPALYAMKIYRCLRRYGLNVLPQEFVDAEGKIKKFRKYTIGYLHLDDWGIIMVNNILIKTYGDYYLSVKKLGMSTKERIISFIKRFPFLHRIAAKGYSLAQERKAIFLGTAFYERYWRTRSSTKKDEWIIKYWDSWNHPHRSFLAKKISELDPFSTVLEIGVNCGPNLHLLTKMFPKKTFYGIDINPEAILVGKKLFFEKGINNVFLSIGKADNLYQFKSKSIDVIFTDALLLYVGPDKIQRAISEMVRVARKGILVLEWHSIDRKEDPFGLGVRHKGLWKRNYVNLFKQLVSEKDISLSKIPQGSWKGTDWELLGYITKVILA